MKTKTFYTTFTKVTLALFVTGAGFVLSPDKIQAAFLCDSGSLSTTCYVSSVQTLADTETISGSGNLIIQNGGELTTAYNSTNHHYDSFVIDISGDLTVQDGGKITGNVDITADNVTIEGDGGNGGGRIDVSYKGYKEGGTRGNGYGPGGGSYAKGRGGGAGYGGNGGNTYYGGAGTSYGILSEPNDLGSGGGASANGSGGSGGGMIKLVVGGTLNLEGSILADGENGNISGGRGSGGGSGGSIWINAGEIQGNGMMSADGGSGGDTGNNYAGGGGAGGRIAIYFNNDNSSLTKKVYSGVNEGYQYGGSGTIYEKDKSQLYGDLIIDNNGNSGAITPITSDISINNYSQGENTQVDIENGVTFTFYGTNLVIPYGATLNNYATFNAASLSNVEINGIFNLKGAYSSNWGNVTINNGGILTHGANTDTKQYFIDLTMDNLIINTGGQINVSEKGYAGGGSQKDGYGPGGGSYAMGRGGGAGYGGNGGDGRYGRGGSSYGVLSEPNDLGSGGGGSHYRSGGTGGGMIKLVVGGTLNLEGSILANGNNGIYYNSRGSGGGSGGSVWIDTGTLQGNGTISVNGGMGGETSGGGGSGGRLRLGAVTNNFTGTYTVDGGTGYQNGEQGTIYGMMSRVTSIADQSAIFDELNLTGDTGSLLGTPNKVEILITDTTNNTYWNGSSWVSTEPADWPDVSGTFSWSYNGITQSNMTNGHTYNIKTKMTDEHTTEQPTSGVTFSYTNGIKDYRPENGITQVDLPTDTGQVSFPNYIHTTIWDSDQYTDLSTSLTNNDGTTIIDGTTVANGFQLLTGATPSGFQATQFQQATGAPSSYLTFFDQNQNHSLQITANTRLYSADTFNGAYIPARDLGTIQVNGINTSAAFRAGQAGQSLLFSAPAKITLNSINGIPYYSTDSSTWNQINQCADGSSTTPPSTLSFPSACYIQTDQTYIWTYHLTDFGVVANSSFLGAADYLSSTMELQTSGTTHEIHFQTAEGLTGGSANNTLTIQFPDDDDTLWCRTPGTITPTTTNLRNSATPLPGTPSASCTQGSGADSYDTITISNLDNLTPTTHYAIRLEENTAQLGTPSTATNGIINLYTNDGTENVESKMIDVYILNPNTIQVTGRVEPTITFNIANDQVGFGPITASNIRYANPTQTGSDALTTATTLTLSTNADDGAIIEIKDLNNGLHNPAASTTLTSQASTNLTAGTEGFSIHGQNPTSLIIAEGFDHDSTADQAITTTYQSLAESTGPVESAQVELVCQTAISGLTPAGDYQDTLTLLATGRF